MNDPPKLVIIETSGRHGQVGFAYGDSLQEVIRLGETRRHARDLAPAVRDLLRRAKCRPRDVAAVIVSKGPGSYTGLRVGIMSAKAFAYATGCSLVAVETFAAIASQAPPEVSQVDVIADAQQQKIYVQQFKRVVTTGQAEWEPVCPLSIVPLNRWITQVDRAGMVTGPGLHAYANDVSDCVSTLDPALWDPQAESLHKVGLARFDKGQRDSIWSIEPLYLRPSSAEEKMQGSGCPVVGGPAPANDN
jgi:tRNA threonylcarbamoyladenosine biosynthesis protein TsaB